MALIQLYELCVNLCERALQPPPGFCQAAVLVLSGLAKIADPQGSVPSSVVKITEFLPYSFLLRLLGAFELVVAGHLIVARTRRTGALVALALFAAFSFLVAANAHDHDFLQNCGCFGGLGETGALKRLSGFSAILLRNSALCGLLAAHLLSTGTPAMRLWPGFGFGLGSAALLFFSAEFVGQRDMAAQARTVQAALDVARYRCAFGLPLPEIGLLAPDRRATTSTRELREGDHVLFFSPTCPHCRRLAPAMAGLAQRLAQRSTRLVLVAVADADRVGEFQRAFGLEASPHYAVANRMEPLRWGIEAVPKLVVMGKGGQAAYHELLPRTAGLSAELAASAPRVEASRLAPGLASSTPSSGAGRR